MKDWLAASVVKSTRVIYLLYPTSISNMIMKSFSAEEIEASCTKLDWSSARLNSYEPDHIEAEVNCQFDCPPTNYDENGRNKEQVLLAIARVIDKNDVTFAIPAINYVNNEP